MVYVGASVFAAFLPFSTLASKSSPADYIRAAAVFFFLALLPFGILKARYSC
jgi:hypothetical protein